MDITIKKVGQRQGKDRFILVNATTRKVLTVNDVSEAALRRFFAKRGVGDALLDPCLVRARQRYDKAAAPDESVDHAADTLDDDNLLFELGLGDDSDSDS